MLDKATKLLKFLRFYSSSAITKNIIKKTSIEKILISNRGEIACRIIRTARKLGIRTVAIFSDIDENALHTRMADEAYNIGPAPSADSYLSMSKIINIAKISNCQAIHPGYGFLSENSDFVELCQNENIIFIGPSASAIRNMGIKNISKHIMTKAGVPVIEGYHGDDQSDEGLYSKARQIGFPLMIKAVCGGGGKGMRIAEKEEHFKSALESARSESQKSFGDSSVLLERLITSPRHIEVQVLADHHGNCVHLFERDCSIQRRHQKVIEETPAPGIPQQLRNELGMTAVLAAKAVDYVGAGTVEFILDKNTLSFFFMEMNTRLQVEHPITEMITGIDLVEWQIKVASGDILSLTQDNITRKGHAFEARIYAENPRENFLPCAGLLKYLSPPKINENVRVEQGVIQGDEVSVFYDPMIAKLVVWGENRSQSLKFLLANLVDYHIAGLETNINFLIRLAKHSALINEEIHTGFIAEHYDDLFPNVEVTEDELCKAALALFLNEQATIKANSNIKKIPNNDPFAMTYLRINSAIIRKYDLESKNKKMNNVSIKWDGSEMFAQVNSSPWKTVKSEFIKESDRCRIRTKINDCVSTFFAYIGEKEVAIFTERGRVVLEIRQPSFLRADDLGQHSNNLHICAPMSGVLEKVLVNPGDKVKKGDSLAIVTAMKMEHILRAPADATIKCINGKKGININKGLSLITLESNDSTDSVCVNANA